jgi:hypothetical protein
MDASADIGSSEHLWQGVQPTHSELIQRVREVLQDGRAAQTRSMKPLAKATDTCIEDVLSSTMRCRPLQLQSNAELHQGSHARTRHELG